MHQKWRVIALQRSLHSLFDDSQAPVSSRGQSHQPTSGKLESRYNASIVFHAFNRLQIDIEHTIAVGGCKPCRAAGRSDVACKSTLHRKCEHLDRLTARPSCCPLPQSRPTPPASQIQHSQPPASHSHLEGCSLQAVDGAGRVG